MKKFTLGEHEFIKIREQDLLYVDKTRQVFDLVDYGSMLFLSRPRRFGKSLLVSTLEALYLGKKELFLGLWIEDKWDWTPRPVVRIDMSKLPLSQGLDEVKNDLANLLDAYSVQYGFEPTNVSIKRKFGLLLENLHKKTGKRVVVLIDEYDKPITDHLAEAQTAEAYRKWFKDFYEALKSGSGDVHFLFITGITKLAKVSIFSVLNNLTDITFEPKLYDIAGVTFQELTDNFEENLAMLETQEGMGRAELLGWIKYWYDGYTWDGKGHVYNPYSLLSLFRQMAFKEHWFETGTPGYLIDLIQKKYTLGPDLPSVIEDFEDVEMPEHAFNSHDLQNINIKVMMFHAGYLTVSKAKNIGSVYGTGVYTLNYPNYEVRIALNSHILDAFINRAPEIGTQTKALLLRSSLEEADEKEFNKLICSIFAGIPSDILKKVNEYYYQSVFYFLLSVLGATDIMLERPGYIGKADATVALHDHVYVFEFKFARKGTVKTLLNNAFKQMDAKGYHLPFVGGGKTVWQVAVGLVFLTPKEGAAAVLKIDTAWRRCD